VSGTINMTAMKRKRNIKMIQAAGTVQTTAEVCDASIPDEEMIRKKKMNTTKLNQISHLIIIITR
jgi:hypothetical protein